MRSRRLPTLVVYGSALLSGLTVVAFPASATVLKEAGLSDSQYGAIFIPQMVLTIVGSLAGGVLARRVGLARLLRWALIAYVLAAAALAATTYFDEWVFALALLGTAAMGMGFGFAAAPLNALPGQLFPERPDSALVALHTVLAFGFALGPVVAAATVHLGAWSAFPAALGVTCVGMAFLVGGVPHGAAKEESATGSAAISRGWLVPFAIVAVLYALAEGSFANWASVYLHEARDVPEATAAFGISAFWVALAMGRLLASGLIAKVGPWVIWLSLPPLMVAAFLLLPAAQGAASGIVLFALAGLASSAFFPVTVSLAARRFPGETAMVSSLLTAALMVGVGVGSFVLGAMRSLPFETIYRVSAVYPGLAFVLAVAVYSLSRSNE